MPADRGAYGVDRCSLLLTQGALGTAGSTLGLVGAIVAQIAKPIANAIRTVLRHTPSQCASCWERRILRRRLPSDRIIRDSGIGCYGMSAAQPLSSTLENRCTLFFECKLRFFSIVCLADNGCLILLIAVSVAQAHVLDYI